MNSKITRITSLPRTIREAYKNHTRTAWLSTGVIVVALVTVFSVFGGDDSSETVNSTKTPSVKVASVSTLSANEAQLKFIGEVRSISQAELRAQKPGKVTGVYVQSGQYVNAGAILGEVENASERAAVLSAQGTVAAAQAQLDKVLAGARGEDKASTIAQAQGAVVTLDAAQDSARNSYSQAYTLAQDAVFAKADTFFTDVYTVNPSFRVRSASYDERQELEQERVRIGEILEVWEQKTKETISDESLNTYLLEAENNLERIKQFLIRISSFISEQEVGEVLTATEKSSQENIILGARTSVDSARSAVNGARSALANALSAAQVAKLNESKTIVGARSEDVAAAEASVTQARGALASAYAALENTLFRTPISGTVTTLNINTGDFVSALETIGVVANEGALEIESFVSDNARKRIAVGQDVRIDGSYEGVVTSVSPGLDPTTKKSRVMIGVRDEVDLVNGAYVDVEIMTNGTEVDDSQVSEISVPITAIKVLPRTTAVFVVNENNTLEVVPIEEGPIIGEKMIIREGLTSDMEIVIDARGLLEGQTVEVVETDNQ